MLATLYKIVKLMYGTRLVSFNQTELNSAIIAARSCFTRTSFSRQVDDGDGEETGRTGGGPSGGDSSDSNGGENGGGGPVATADGTGGR